MTISIATSAGRGLSDWSASLSNQRVENTSFSPGRINVSAILAPLAEHTAVGIAAATLVTVPLAKFVNAGLGGQLGGGDFAFKGELGLGFGLGFHESVLS